MAWDGDMAADFASHATHTLESCNINLYAYILYIIDYNCMPMCMYHYIHTHVYIYIYIIVIIIVIIVVVIFVIIIIITLSVLLLLFLSLLLCFICGYTMLHMHLESVG